MKIFLLLITISLLGNNPEKMNRRGFFAKIQKAYLEGRHGREHKRWLERHQREKERRRFVKERNIKTLVDGISRRLKRGPSNVKLVVIGGVGLVIWLCHKGSIGCDGREEKD